jgi:hypothetical protein
MNTKINTRSAADYQVVTLPSSIPDMPNLNLSQDTDYSDRFAMVSLNPIR